MEITVSKWNECSWNGLWNVTVHTFFCVTWEGYINSYELYKTISLQLIRVPSILEIECISLMILGTEKIFYTYELTVNVRIINSLADLVKMPNSVCNHELPIVCCRLCRHHMWTVLLSTHLIMEVSHIYVCIYAPSVGLPNIRSVWPIFSKWQPICYSTARLICTANARKSHVN